MIHNNTMHVSANMVYVALIGGAREHPGNMFMVFSGALLFLLKNETATEHVKQVRAPT